MTEAISPRISFEKWTYREERTRAGASSDKEMKNGLEFHKVWTTNTQDRSRRSPCLGPYLPLLTMTTFLGSKSGSLGGVWSNGWHSSPNLRYQNQGRSFCRKLALEINPTNDQYPNEIAYDNWREMKMLHIKRFVPLFVEKLKVSV